MCFRPGTVDTLKQEQNCPECGGVVKSTGIEFPSSCPHCKADLSMYAEEFKAKASFAPPPGAPGARKPPAPPAAPGAPGAPKPPSAPKVPGA